MEGVQYSLYVDRNMLEFKIKRHNKPKYLFCSNPKENLEKYNNNEIINYNGAYYLCRDRKKLKQFGQSIIDRLILDKEFEILKLKNTKL